MNIGEAAKKSGLSVKTVRYYDEINLIKPIKNKATNYRHYTTADLAKLQFIGKARRFNFSIKECKELLSLYENQNRSSKEVRNLTLTKIAEIDVKLTELENLREQLSHLVNCCKGNERPECPIIDELATGNVF
ncbi:MAG: Cu(I)-responsive transcriptional regulator [Paracoccaceae bacterium]|jgi:Cu(I)-responsive transcriptional regulator|tara:strand:- start:20 stop:418 length:399 start_codon:yes stop_codon:yes gene_type:complete